MTSLNYTFNDKCASVTCKTVNQVFFLKFRMNTRHIYAYSYSLRSHAHYFSKCHVSIKKTQEKKQVLRVNDRELLMWRYLESKLSYSLSFTFKNYVCTQIHTKFFSQDTQHV